MSRIIVKNLPKKITEEELKKHFSAKGDITDVKIMKKPNGDTRNFCFIGYRDEKSAKEAVKYFNGTYVNTVKVIVEIAKLQGDPSLKPKGKNSKINKSKEKEEKINEENSKESKIKKILELAEQTKNSHKFDEALKKIKNQEEKEEELKDENINEENKEEDNKEKKNKIIKKEEKNLKDEESIQKEDNKSENEDKKGKSLNPKRLYLRNLPFQITEEELEDSFSKFGKISEIHIPINYKTNQSLGYGYITYETVESSVKALSSLDGEYFKGRRLHISIAEEKSEKKEKSKEFKKPFENKTTGESSYKTEKRLELKKNYNNETNWNYLFLNQSAVLDEVSKRLKISKEDLLNKDNADQAVIISQMETAIIKETKEWLSSEGINLDLLKGKRTNCIRSKTIIFVKNISSKISKEDLEKLFSRYGSLIRFIVSPSNTLAICEYYNAKHASNCIKHLAYYQLEGVPLYLEYAPEGIINKSEEIKNKENISEEEEKKEEKINIIEGEGKIIFVSNLNFSTTEKQLKHFFESKDYHINKIEIAKHNKEGKQVSSGYAFVEFNDDETAMKVLKNCNGRLLGGHAIKLSLSKSANKVDEKYLQKKREREKKETELHDYEYEGDNISNTKLLIKNLAFEANKVELRKLFKTYGQVKTVRIPMKIDGGHRGFAFIDFASHEEALKAFKECQNTHFYGRKLNIQWAQQESTVDELREKTKQKSMALNVKTNRTLKKGEMYVNID